MDTIGFFTSEEKKLFFSKYRLLLRNLYSFLEREDIRKMKELMKRVVALDCYGRDKNGINGLLRNIDTALIATLEIGLKRTSVIALLLYRPVLKKAITIEEVEQKFGADVTLIIRRLLKILRLVCPEHRRQLGEFPSFAFLVCRGRTCDLAYDRRPPLPHAYGKTDARG